MKDKPNEWVSISDLMAGVMAVVMLMLVMSVLQKNYADIKHKAELEQGSASQRKQMTRLMSDLKDSVTKQGTGSLVQFDIDAGKITLRDGVFSRGSACITPEAQVIFASVQKKISAFLTDVRDSQILVEGHTDNLPVLKPVTDYERYCTVYDDNYTLSAARAREARRLIAGSVNTEMAKRIVVAGYGDSQPLVPAYPGDAKNRRVEVRFLIQGPESTAIGAKSSALPQKPMAR